MSTGGRLGAFVEAHNLGEVYSETGFQIGSNERIPDVAFVSLQHFPPESEPEGEWLIAPDLAVEVISPNDIFDKMLSRMKEYLAAGVKQVWLISTEHKIVIIHRSLAQATFFSEGDELVSEDLLPGFRCRVSELFKSPVNMKQREKPVALVHSWIDKGDQDQGKQSRKYFFGVLDKDRTSARKRFPEELKGVSW
jgi:hypothetical protein